ncbi:DUF1656 domain-containing protein [Paraburkholderia sediminicola]|uniref:DUF1656 domain-containing protein n=1 Tax=Paraburkholderia sediminicola TaxID=458836 RepID=UPI0038B75519
MPREIVLLSLLVPTLLPLFLGCAMAYWIVDRALARMGLFRHVWHPALFRAALFVCLFSGVSLLLGT